MARESGLSRWLMDARRTLPGLQITRVENSVGAGFPDVDGYLREYGAFQIELKSTKRPARESTPLRFALRGRDAQIDYLARRWVLGGAAFFLLQVGDGADRTLYLAPGSAGARLRAGITESELAALCGPACIFRRCTAADLLTRMPQCRATSKRSQRPGCASC